MAVLCFDAKTNTLLDNILRLLREHSCWTPVNIEQLRQLTVFLEWCHAVTPQATDGQILTDLKAQIAVYLDPSKATKLHKDVSHALQTFLQLKSPKYDVQNEFSGLKSGVFPVDCVVYLDGKIVAFVEIDGPHHYTSEGKLKRDSLIKEYLYSVQYPEVKMLRVRNEEILVKDGMTNVVSRLTKQISNR